MGLYDDDQEPDLSAKLPEEKLGGFPEEVIINEKKKDVCSTQTQTEATIMREPVKYDLKAHANLIPTHLQKQSQKSKISKPQKLPTKFAWNRAKPFKHSGSVQRSSETITPKALTFDPYKMKLSHVPPLSDDYWDQDYDPSEPNKMDMYPDSEEHLAEQEDWQLYLEDIKTSGLSEESDIRYGIGGNNDDPIEESAISNEDPEELLSEMELKNNIFRPSRLLKKYGWKPGRGLGPRGDGITKALHLKRSRYRPGTGYILDRNKSLS